MGLKPKKKEDVEQNVVGENNSVAQSLNDEEKEVLSSQKESEEAKSKEISLDKMQAVVSLVQNTFNLSSQLAGMQAAQQLANCHTDQNVSSAFAQLNYNLATEACADRAAITNGARDIIDNSNANTRAILDFLVQDRITALTTENQALKGQISQSAQSSYLISQLRPNPIPAYLTTSPYYGFGYGMGGGFYGPSNIIA